MPGQRLEIVAIDHDEDVFQPQQPKFSIGEGFLCQFVVNNLRIQQCYI